MDSQVSAAIEYHFGDLEDPRIDRTKLHKLLDILVIAIYAAICGADNLCHLRGFSRWKKLQTVSRIRSQRWVSEDKRCEDRYHITSITGAKRVLAAVRSHWSIENELHWTLDIAFDEDHCRVRKDPGPEDLAVLRHIALNLLKQEKTCKRSIRGKRLLAGWRQDYLLKVLAGLGQLAD